MSSHNTMQGQNNSGHWMTGTLNADATPIPNSARVRFKTPIVPKGTADATMWNQNQTQNGGIAQNITLGQQLESITPQQSVDWFLRRRERDNETAAKTVRNNRYNLGKFSDWAEETGFGDMNQMNGIVADDYVEWIFKQELAPMTTQNIIRTFRTMLQHLEGKYVNQGVSELVVVPGVDDDDEARSEYIALERAKEILSYLYKYEYASRRHVIYHLILRTGARRGAIHSLDVDDWHSDERYLTFEHRPNEGTTLKNKSRGERAVYVHDDRLAETLDDWVDDARPDVTDEYGREPLVASNTGRLCESAISYNVVATTRPTYYGGIEPSQCPCVGLHGANEDEKACPGTRNQDAWKCGESIGPHALRRSAVTAMLNAGFSKEDIGDRVDMTTAIMDKHYNQQSPEEEMSVRKNRMDSV